MDKKENFRGKIKFSILLNDISQGSFEYSFNEEDVFNKKDRIHIVIEHEGKNTYSKWIKSICKFLDALRFAKD